MYSAKEGDNLYQTLHGRKTLEVFGSATLGTLLLLCCMYVCKILMNVVVVEKIKFCYISQPTRRVAIDLFSIIYGTTSRVVGGMRL